MIPFWASLCRVAAIAGIASAAGWVAAGALLPAIPGRRAERLGWGVAIGCGLIAAYVPLSLVVGVRPGWAGFLLLAVACVGASRLLGVPGSDGAAPPSPPEPRGAGTRAVNGALWVAVAVGVAVYALRALTEPMWANDFIAIWGLKGKTIYGAAAVPSRLYDWPPLRYSHPEYPLGLPFLFAGIAFLAGTWDDHALALLYPIFQIATLASLWGWLRRRGASRVLALSAVALLANLDLLYSGAYAGLAEVPLAWAALLLGISLSDVLDQTDAGALRRLAVASALAAAVKDEGLFLALAAAGIAMLWGGARRLRASAAAALPALAVFGLHLAWRGPRPLSDFDFSLLSPARWAELPPRLAAAAGAAARLPGPWDWAALGLLLLVWLLGSRTIAGDRLLILAACGAAAYLLLPALGRTGPVWLVETSWLRTTSALAPLVAAAVALRFTGESRPA